MHVNGQPSSGPKRKCNEVVRTKNRRDEIRAYRENIEVPTLLLVINRTLSRVHFHWQIWSLISYHWEAPKSQHPASSCSLAEEINICLGYTHKLDNQPSAESNPTHTLGYFNLWFIGSTDTVWLDANIYNDCILCNIYVTWYSSIQVRQSSCRPFQKKNWYSSATANKGASAQFKVHKLET